MRGKTGRPTVLVERGLTVEQIVSAVRGFNGSVKFAAESLGLAEKTVRRYLPKDLRTKALRSTRNKLSRSALWLATEDWPKSLDEFVKRSGIPESTCRRVESQLRQEFLDEMIALGDFRNEHVYLYDENDRRFWSKFILAYELDVDPWKRRVIVRGSVSAGRATFVVSEAVFRSLFTSPK
jgi:hypothetical protein